MPAKNQALTVTYTAWDTVNNVGKTGDAANHTLKVVVDGTEQSVTGAISEVDSTSCKGEYKVTLTAANLNGNMVKFCGVSSTAGVAIIPIAIFTDGGVLPFNAAPGTSGGLPTSNGSNQVASIVGGYATGEDPASLVWGATLPGAFTGNQADWGGAIYTNGCDLTLVNCTVANNSGYVSGNGVLSYVRVAEGERMQVHLNLTDEGRWVQGLPGRVLLSSSLDGDGYEVSGWLKLRAAEALVIEALEG